MLLLTKEENVATKPTQASPTRRAFHHGAGANQVILPPDSRWWPLDIRQVRLSDPRRAPAEALCPFGRREKSKNPGGDAVNVGRMEGQRGNGSGGVTKAG